MDSSLLFLVPGCDHRRTVFSHSLIIKEGSVKKCRYRDTRLPKPYKFKKRYCWLSTENFLYAKTNDSQVILAPFLRVTSKWISPLSAKIFSDTCRTSSVPWSDTDMSKDKYPRCFRAKWTLLCLFSFKCFHNTSRKIGEYHWDIVLTGAYSVTWRV